MTSPSPHRCLAASFALALAGCSAGSLLPRVANGPTVLEIRGAVRGGPFHLGEGDLRALAQRTVHGIDPASPRPEETRYSGVDLANLVSDQLDLVGEADTILFHTADRLVVSVPLSVVRQLRPVLADRADGARLDLRVVAWPTVAQRGVTTDPRFIRWWAHGVTTLEVVSAVRTLGRALQVPVGAPPGALAGATLYGDRCLSCHRIRGRGGQRGPELTRVADRLTPAAIRKILQGHPGWHIPGRAEPTAEDAAQLDLFLRTVAAYEVLGGPTPDQGEVEGEAGEPQPPPPLEPPAGW